MTKNCKDCKYCRVVPENRTTGICTEEHGPRNARGNTGTLVPTARGACRYFTARVKRPPRKLPEVSDAVTE